MNNRSKPRNILLDLLLIAALISILVIILNSNSLLANLVSSTTTPVSTRLQPSFIAPKITSSPTPAPGEIITPATIVGVPTTAYSKIIDTAPDLPLGQKFSVQIKRSNGDLELYYVRPELSDLTGVVTLQPGDEIISWVASGDFMAHSVPPVPTSLLTPHPSVTSIPTLPPFYTPTPNSYPAPE